MSMPDLVAVSDAQECAAGSDWDAVVAVGPSASFPDATEVQAVLEQSAALDARLLKDGGFLAAPPVAGGRLVFSPTGPLDRDYDDVRRFAAAAAKGIARARDAGARRPLLLLGGVPETPLFRRAVEVCLLGACQALWQPLEAREARGEDEVEPVQRVGFVHDDAVDGDALAQGVMALEAGRRLARDLGGTEPERMAPARFAEYCEEAFADGPVRVEVVEDVEQLEKEYPLAMAVGRASLAVPRHRPRVVRLVYDCRLYTSPSPRD